MALASCEKDAEVEPFPQLLEIPADFPDIPFPSDNAYSYDRWILGKRLFYDTRLSKNNSLSCNSCHIQSLAFSDSVSISPGVFGRLGMRNAPSLANMAYHPYYTREGGLSSLEKQILVPIQEHEEFDNNIVPIAETLKADAEINQLSLLAYDRPVDAFVITRSIATFERTLISGNSTYDIAQRNALKPLSSMAIEGQGLFFSERTNCSKCHSGFNFSNYAFENNGLYEVYADIGRMRLTNDPKDEALFKVPSLRNIELTAPYMHDGSIRTLADVIDHYNSGGINHPHKSPLVKPLALSDHEKAALLAFLKTLTDRQFTENPLFFPN